MGSSHHCKAQIHGSEQIGFFLASPYIILMVLWVPELANSRRICGEQKGGGVLEPRRQSNQKGASIDVVKYSNGPCFLCCRSSNEDKGFLEGIAQHWYGSAAQVLSARCVVQAGIRGFWSSGLPETSRRDWSGRWRRRGAVIRVQPTAVDGAD